MCAGARGTGCSESAQGELRPVPRLRRLRFVRPALRLVDCKPQLLLAPPVAMVHRACVGAPDPLSGQRCHALLALEPRLSKPTRGFARVDCRGTPRGHGEAAGLGRYVRSGAKRRAGADRPEEIPETA